MSPVLAGRFLTTGLPGKPMCISYGRLTPKNYLQPSEFTLCPSAQLYWQGEVCKALCASAKLVYCYTGCLLQGFELILDEWIPVFPVLFVMILQMYHTELHFLFERLEWLAAPPLEIMAETCSSSPLSSLGTCHGFTPTEWGRTHLWPWLCSPGQQSCPWRFG